MRYEDLCDLHVAGLMTRWPGTKLYPLAMITLVSAHALVSV